MKIKEVKLSDIQPYFNNPRDNTAAIKPTAESIKRYGFQKPIIVDKDGIIIAGHTRFHAAIQLNMEKVPVIYSDMDEEKAKMYRIADNKLAEKSEYDSDELLDELKKLQTPTDMQPFFFEDLETVLNFDMEQMFTPESNNFDPNEGFDIDDDDTFDEAESYSDEETSNEEGTAPASTQQQSKPEPPKEDPYATLFKPYQNEEGEWLMDVLCPYCRNRETIKLNEEDKELFGI